MDKHQKSILLFTEWADPRFHQGVARYARRANWHLNLDAVYGRRLPADWKGDGCIHMVESREALAFIEKLNVPCPVVCGDAKCEGSEAADYFAHLGFRHFVCYTTDRSEPITRLRFGGYEERLKQMGLSATLLAWGKTGSEKGIAWGARKQWLSEELKKQPKPVAVFCIDDRLALSAVEACMDAGIEIPGEVAVLGVGNMELACECSAVPISSIRIDFDTLGYEAAAQLDRILDGEPVTQPYVVPAGGIEERRSTYTLAVDDERGRKALRFMLDHFHEPIGVNDIAKAGRLTRWQLTTITRRDLDTTPTRLLEDTRVKKSCELLRTTNYPIKRVAYETGLGTALRLQRIFRKRFECSPSAWRKAQEEAAGGQPRR
ncbi:MAG: substrate-binding domain-containing protein [Kiritimatiellae bacterium]|nr:substrate-binding domain-containing protein [Kiritimatiellia bacterium]